MISITAAVSLIVTLLIVACIFGLLAWLIGFVASKVPWIAPFAQVGYIILAILGVLVLIGILLSFLYGQPLFRP